MTLKLISHTPRALLAAGLFLGAVAAQAATGYTISKGQEDLVRPGMTTAEVQAALGKPSMHIHYRNEPGPTFTYDLAGMPDTLFDVDFGADGKVASTSERFEERD
jgi:hypothetical protein